MSGTRVSGPGGGVGTTPSVNRQTRVKTLLPATLFVAFISVSCSGKNRVTLPCTIFHSTSNIQRLFWQNLICRINHEYKVEDDIVSSSYYFGCADFPESGAKLTSGSEVTSGMQTSATPVVMVILVTL